MPGVYISYPFCAQKCTYCNFASGVFPRDLEPRYLGALEREIRAHQWEWLPQTLYLGGGTPSNIAPGELRALLDAIPGRPWAEATIEAAPGNITAEMARAWAACGINRVSLGVQSFVEEELRRTGRKHTAAIVAQEIRVLRDAGIHNVNIDLIAGLSGQTEASGANRSTGSSGSRPRTSRSTCWRWTRTAAWARRCCWAACGTAQRMRPATMPPPRSTKWPSNAWPRWASRATRFPTSRGPGFESRHNLKYWTLEPYAGFGADAHSFDGRMRYQNAESLEEYLRSATVAPTPAHLEDERFYLGLRLTAGIRPDPAEWLRYEQPIRRFLDAGLLEKTGGVLRLTGRGVLLSNEVFQEFLT